MKLYIKTEKIILKIADIEIKKQNFYQYKRPISIKNIALNKIVVSNKVFLCIKGFKYFIGYQDAKLRPLSIFLPKMSAYRKDFHETKCIFFYKRWWIIGKYNKIWKNR